MYLESHGLELQTGDVIWVDKYEGFTSVTGRLIRFERCYNHSYRDCDECKLKTCAVILPDDARHTNSKCLCPGRKIMILNRANTINKCGEI